MSGRLPLMPAPAAREDLEAVADCLESGWLTLGPRTLALEERLAEWSGAPHAIVVSSGTAALQLVLRALGVGPGCDVVVPAFAGLGPATATAFLGGRAVPADVRSATDPAVDVRSAGRVVGASTRAVVVTHTLGWPADTAPFRELGVPVVEDATQATGAVLPRGDEQTIRCFSFSSASQLPIGEGGLVACWDDELARTVRSLRAHAMTSGTWDRHRGHHDSYDIIDLGYNFRLDEPRAALATARLSRLSGAVAARRDAVQALRRCLAEEPGFEVPFGGVADRVASPAVLPLLARDRPSRDLVARELDAEGVPRAVWEASGTDAPRAREAADRMLLVALTEHVTVGWVKLLCELARRSL